MTRHMLPAFVLAFSAAAAAGAETPHWMQTYELAVHVAVEGDEVVLSTGATCDWGSFPKAGWWGIGFSVGTRLPSGRGLYMWVDGAFCREENSPGRNDWAALAEEPPVDITDTPPVLLLSDSFEAPTVFFLPHRQASGGYRINDAGFELVSATWHPLAGDEISRVPTPVIDPRRTTLAVTQATGISLVPVPMALFELREAPFARDPSGRYALYRLQNWEGDSPLKGNVTVELLRRARPLLPAGDGAVTLGPPGRAVTLAYPQWSSFDPFRGLDLIVDGWTVPDGAGWDTALLDTAEGLVYLPRRLNGGIATPLPEAYAR